MSSDAAGAPRPFLARAEDLLLALALGAMLLLPAAEMALRAAGQAGIPGAQPVVQHLVLVVGMLGGAVAAREKRMLALSTAEAFLREPWRARAILFAHTVAAAVAAWLTVAGWSFVQQERETAGELAWGVPTWCVLLALPIGFGLIALRLALAAGPTWRARGIALLAAAAIVAFYGATAIEPASLTVVSLVALALATLLGAPLFVALGGAALVLVWSDGDAIVNLANDHHRLVTNPTLAAIPLFTLAGYFLAEGGASRRLLVVFEAWFGALRGGPAVVTALACAFFTSFTGASGVTILALGGLLMPVLLRAGYAQRPALGLLTSAGSLGMLFPPCLPLVLYAIVAELPLEQMFLGGILPGALLVVLVAAWGVRAGPPREPGKRFEPRVAWRAAWEAKWELATPLVVLGLVFGGVATPVEAASLTAIYAAFTQVVVHRDLSPVRGVTKALVECGLVVGGVLLILGLAQGLTTWMIYNDAPGQVLELVTANIESPLLFLLALNVFLLIVGCLMDVFSATIVVVPLLIPLGAHYGIDPLHLGIVFLANLELGYLTPPVGMNLFMASYRLNQPLPVVYRSVLPVLCWMFAGVLLITYWPALTTWLPSLFP